MNRADIVIIGGGVMGCSTAYHLLAADPALAVLIVEKDLTYSRASSALSVGNARVQFSLRQNIEISLHTFEVLRRFPEEMEVDGDRPDVGFRQEGNLFLADADGERSLRQAGELQRRLGGEVEWWSPAEIEDRFPLLRAREYAGGAFGRQDGHLDGYALLMAYRRKAIALGARTMEDEVTGIWCEGAAVAGVELGRGGRLRSPIVLNCAGAWAAQVVRGIQVELPVSPVQRQVFVVEPEVKPDKPLPLTSLPSGLYLRSESAERILVGKSLPEDPVGFDLRWQESRFSELLWPELVGLVPAFERLRFERGWAGLYAMNTFDGNAILGEWPAIAGLYLACGFSGHGLQQAPAVGRYMAELILGRPHALDLSIFAPGRLLENRPVEERALV